MSSVWLNILEKCRYVVMKFLAILTILMALGLSGTALAENATIDSVTFQGDVFEFSLDKPHLVTNCNVDVY